MTSIDLWRFISSIVQIWFILIDPQCKLHPYILLSKENDKLDIIASMCSTWRCSMNPEDSENVYGNPRLQCQMFTLKSFLSPVVLV